MENKKNNKNEYAGLFGTASMVGINFVVCTFIGFAIGHWLLDPLFGSGPWFTIIFIFLGIAAGFKSLLKFAGNTDEKSCDHRGHNDL